MLTVACYSAETAYEQEAELLRASLDRVGMRHHIEGFESQGGWYANTAYKATFLNEMRERFLGPLLYVDVDAFVHQNCDSYFDGLAARGIDFGAHWYRGPAKGNNRREVRPDGWRMLSGTLFLGDTAMCRILLRSWVALNATWRDLGIVQGGGQKNLWFTLTCLPDVRVERLPGRYCYAFDRAFAYDRGERPLIEHTMASRDHRGGEKHTEGRARRVMELKKLVQSPVAVDKMQAYWQQRYARQGPSYVAEGGKEDSSVQQVAVLSPYLRSLVRGKKVLDFGCGPGRFRSVLEEEGREYTGVDLIPEFGTQPLGERLVGEYDTVVAVFVLQHIVDPAIYNYWTQEIWNCLRPGGRLIVVDHDVQPRMEAHMAPRGMGGLKRLEWAHTRVMGRFRGHWIGLLEKPGRTEDVTAQAGADSPGDGAYCDRSGSSAVRAAGV